MQNFEELALQASTITAIRKMKYETPTPVQAQAIPALLDGKDVLAQARTGTGKTAAFGVPLIDGLVQYGGVGPIALILVPTRELALQVTEVLEQLAYGTKIRVIPVFGGTGYNNQQRGLQMQNPLIVVATPGRLLDHMTRRTININNIVFLVLDEADRMLDMGFRPDVERILKQLPKDRQTSLFSATIPNEIAEISRRFMQNPVKIRIESGPQSTPDAEQFKLHVPGGQRAAALEKLLAFEKPERAIVFTRTKHRAKRLAKELVKAGWKAVALQGNMSQSQRERALDSFRAGDAHLLVATDVASRGLDVPEVTHVVNFDVPVEPEAYVHRIGRTGRMGRKGRAITFVGPEDAHELRALESVGGVKLRAYAYPTAAPNGAPMEVATAN
jgi:ATP-dependent RNA helicase DeaD